MSRKILLSIFACISPLFFPWQIVGLVALVASWFFPWTALAVGLIEDVLYAPTYHDHHALFIGAVVTLCMYGVQYIVKTRIIQS